MTTSLLPHMYAHMLSIVALSRMDLQHACKTCAVVPLLACTLLIPTQTFLVELN